MADMFFSGSRLIVTDSRYKDVYNLLSKQSGLNINTIFLLTLLLGYRENRQGQGLKQGGAEFRPSYFKQEQKLIILGIIYELFGKDTLNNIDDSSLLKEIEEKLQLYSNGGMEILLENFLGSNPINGEFVTTYTNADIDLLKFIFEKLSVHH